MDAWVAERRKRWPTAQKVEEKKAKMEEAIARGQLPLTGSSSRGTKRRREEGEHFQRDGTRFNRNNARQRKQRQSMQTDGQKTQGLPPVASQPPRDMPLEEKAPAIAGQVAQSSDRDDDETTDDGEPEVISSKQPVELTISDTLNSGTGGRPTEKSVQKPGVAQNPTKPKRKEPRLPPRNPFASRPTLLRNVGVR